MNPAAAQNKYEAIFIFRPDKEKEIEALVKGVKELLAKNSAHIEKEEAWGKKQIAYPIKHNAEGLYYKVNFEAPPSAIKTLDASFRLNQDILRTLIIKR